jgi:hypothetical protein
MNRFMERVQPHCPNCGYGRPPPTDPVSLSPVVERGYSFGAGADGPESLVLVTCGKCSQVVQFDRKASLDA